MKYLYSATFTDGTEFDQAEDDSSVIMPGKKSSFYDFLEHRDGRSIESFWLDGDDLSVSVDHATGVFTIFAGGGSCAVVPGDPLFEPFEWVEGDPRQSCYFRKVTKAFNGTQDLGTVTQFCVGVRHVPGVKNFLGVY